MTFFGWQAWRQRLDDKDPGNLQVERWHLQKLHGPAELSELAFLVAKRLAASDVVAQVQVQSVWIDSLPQAVGRALPIGFEQLPPAGLLTMLAEPVKCELADLLYVVKLVDYGGTRERALLLQGKMATEANRLPAGSSTKTERALLERHRWTDPIELYRGQTASPASCIGRFSFGSPTSPGLMAFARYLLIAKAPGWKSPSPLSPYAVGWPQETQSPYLRAIGHVDLAQCAVDMAGTESAAPGQPTPGCHQEWDSLIYALRNGNTERHFKGYGGQPYVRNSEVVDTRAVRERTLADWFDKALGHKWIDPRLPVVGWHEPYAWHAGGQPPKPPRWDSDEEPGGFPLIPVITVTIAVDGTWQRAVQG